jgi:twitching motility protein PilT
MRQLLSPRLEREGSVDFALEEPGIGRFRVNVGRQRTGLKASLRLIPAEIPTLASLGLPDAIGLASRHHQGFIVITGPTGHGKTTTLAAIVDLLNRESARHIITVEDPVEYVHPRKRAMMSQREVGTHTRAFQAALKAALREDPDVIVVGELRDTETVRMALIREGKTLQIPNLMQAGRAAGMQTMDAALEQLVQRGTITAEEALEKATDKDAFQKSLRHMAAPP